MAFNENFILKMLETKIALDKNIENLIFQILDINPRLKDLKYNRNFLLRMACKNNDLNEVKSLIKDGNIDINSKVALSFAIKNNNLEMVKVLLQNGCKSTFKTAFDAMNLEILLLLIKNYSSEEKTMTCEDVDTLKFLLPTQNILDFSQ